MAYLAQVAMYSPGFRADGRNPHFTHKPFNPFMIDIISQGLKRIGDSWRSIAWDSRVDFVDFIHDFVIQRVFRLFLIIIGLTMPPKFGQCDMLGSPKI